MMYCSGYPDKKHSTCKMKYYHTSDGCTHWACTVPSCGRVTIVCRRLPPIWIRKTAYKQKQNDNSKKSFWSFLR